VFLLWLFSPSICLSHQEQFVSTDFDSIPTCRKILVLQVQHGDSKSPRHHSCILLTALTQLEVRQQLGNCIHVESLYGGSTRVTTSSRPRSHHSIKDYEPASILRTRTFLSVFPPSLYIPEEAVRCRSYCGCCSQASAKCLKLAVDPVRCHTCGDNLN
jgi:hypothetical protein